MNSTANVARHVARTRNGHLKEAILVALPLVTGMVATILTAGGMARFAAVAHSPLSPPVWVFPAVWSILYLLMGLASMRAYRARPTTERGRCLRRDALLTYGLQLGINFLWPILFFGLGLYWPAFGALVVMWLLAATCAVLSFRVSRLAGALLLPLVLWITFVGYLNACVAMLN